MSAPASTAAPEALDSSTLRALLTLAVSGLQPMFDADRRLFCDRLVRTENGMSRQGVSERYTAMTLLGLNRYERAGFQSPFPVCDLAAAGSALTDAVHRYAGQPAGRSFDGCRQAVDGEFSGGPGSLSRLSRRRVHRVTSADLKLKGFQGKYLHKKALAPWVSREVAYRPKKGFAHPVDKWLRGRMRGFVDECLLSETSSVNRYFNRDYIRRMVQDHEAGRQNYLRHIYLLISFELWHRRFIPT